MPNRIIKESIHTSDDVNAMSDFEFRLWVSLLVYVDDYGRGDARPAIIKGACFPLRERLTAKDISAALQNLAGIGCVGLYEVDGKPYLYFPKWASHQNIRNKQSKFPAPPDCDDLQSIDSNCNQAQANAPVIQSNTNPNPNPNPIEPNGSCAAPETDAPPVAIISLPLIDKTEYAVSPKQCQEWAGLYPAVDVMQQLRNMRGWLDANPANRKTRNGIKRFINAWLTKAQNQAGRVKPKAGGNVFLEIAREEGLT